RTSTATGTTSATSAWEMGRHSSLRRVPDASLGVLEALLLVASLGVADSVNPVTILIAVYLASTPPAAAPSGGLCARRLHRLPAGRRRAHAGPGGAAAQDALRARGS